MPEPERARRARFGGARLPSRGSFW
jgi:hypothetical protein